MSYLCTPTIINNTITQNRPSTNPTTPAGSGIYAYAGSGFTGKNNIIYGNVASLNPEFYGNVNLTYSCSSEQLTGTGNIVDDPEFVAPAVDDFHLQVTSPCIDTGDPMSPLDPDGSRADMGALYYNHSAAQTLDVTLAPINPPIVVPANGGSFSFNASVQRTQAPQAAFSVWARIKNPDGTYTPPTLGPVSINPPVGVTVTRQRTQSVPGSWAAGVYTYLGYANNTFTYPAIDSSSFTFTKSPTAIGESWIVEATCSGEPFPGEIIGTPTTHAVLSNYPNPFNPSTTIRYSLNTAVNVALNVYDINGRQVTQLVNSYRDAGSHEVTFDGSNLASGLYLYCLEAEGHSNIGKMMLMK